jgi:peptide/nickel transport system substrate-binding protein
MSYKRQLRWMRAVAIAVALPGLVLSACGNGSSRNASTGTEPSGSSAAGRGGQLVWGKPGEAPVLDPAGSGSASAWELMHLVYDTLVDLDGNLNPTPDLAESWRQTSPTTYTFRIRRDVKFSNGRPMTVDDVVGSLNRLDDPKLAAAWAGQLAHARFSTDGPSRVKATLQEPRSSFLAALANLNAAVLPMRELRAGAFDPKKELLGTGPFKVVAHSQDESWTLVRNPSYWRAGNPKIDRLLVRIMPEDTARIAALRDGSIDVATFATPDVVRLLKGQAGITTVVQDTTDYYLVDLNAVTSTFRDDRLRTAVSLAIDRAKIIDLALGGVGSASAATAPAFRSACDLASVPFTKPDVRRAQQLIKEAGARGRKVTIVVSAYLKTLPQIAQVVQQQLKDAGFDARILQLDQGAFVKRVFEDKRAPFDIAVNWFTGYADPAMVLGWWNPDVAGFTKPWFKRDAELDQLVDKSLKVRPGAPERQGLLQQACGRVAQGANIIPIATKPAIVAYRSEKASLDLQHIEGYGIPLRLLPAFTVR